MGRDRVADPRAMLSGKGSSHVKRMSRHRSATASSERKKSNAASMKRSASANVSFGKDDNSGRHSWIDSSAKINGLYAVQRKREKFTGPETEDAKVAAMASQRIAKEESCMQMKLSKVLEERCTKAEAQVEMLNCQVSALNFKLGEFGARASQSDEECTAMAKVIKDLREKLEMEEARTRNQAATIDEMGEKLNLSLERMTNLYNDQEKLCSTLNNLNENLERNDEEIVSLRQALEGECAAKNAAQVKQDEMERKCASLEEKVASLESLHAEATNQVSATQSRIKLLAAEKDAMHETVRKMTKERDGMQQRYKEECKKVKSAEKKARQAFEKCKEEIEKQNRLNEQVRALRKRRVFLENKIESIEKLSATSASQIKMLSETLVKERAKAKATVKRTEQKHTVPEGESLFKTAPSATRPSKSDKPMHINTKRGEMPAEAYRDDTGAPAWMRADFDDTNMTIF